MEEENGTDQMLDEVRPIVIPPDMSQLVSQYLLDFGLVRVLPELGWQENHWVPKT